MQKSETIGKLATALNKAQAEMSGAKKSAANPFFKSKYANLEEVINCVKEPFANNELSFMQFPTSQDGFAGVETIILHSSGEWVSGEFMLKCAKNDPQGMGSAITYARRYGLQAAAGVPAEDDDGNAATQGKAPAKPAVKKAQAKPHEPAKRVPITSTQKDNLKLLREKAGLADERYRAGVTKASGGLTDMTSNLTEGQAANLISMITKIIEDNNQQAKA